MFRTQRGIYGQAGTHLLMKTYTNLLEAFSNDVTLSLQEAPLFSEEQMNQAVGLGRGKRSPLECDQGKVLTEMSRA